MFPELFEVPFIHTRFNLYGTMIVLGFLAAVLLMRSLARKSGDNPEYITNMALYALIAGIVGARIFYVFHHFEQFRGRPFSVFALWNGGLEFVGGVILGTVVLLCCLTYKKLSIRKCLDILSIGLLLALAVGRIGCFLGNGCCFGKPADLPWSVRFPYNSDAYRSQIYPNPDRKRPRPYIDLPAEYFGYLGEDGKTWFPTNERNKHLAPVKPLELLTPAQKYDVTKGKYRCLPIHPTQLYSSIDAFAICAVLLFFWRKFNRKLPGCTFFLMFIMYGTMRFFIEFLRDGNPFEYAWWAIYKGATISQNIGIYMVIVGLPLFIIFYKIAKKHVPQT